MLVKIQKINPFGGTSIYKQAVAVNRASKTAFSTPC